jgi:hypothetical protein
MAPLRPPWPRNTSTPPPCRARPSSRAAVAAAPPRSAFAASVRRATAASAPLRRSAAASASAELAADSPRASAAPRIDLALIPHVVATRACLATSPSLHSNERGRRSTLDTVISRPAHERRRGRTNARIFLYKVSTWLILDALQTSSPGEFIPRATTHDAATHPLTARPTLVDTCTTHD